MAMGGSGSGGTVRADINVTPMIDVMLVLLIIFMIVTPAITAGFQATIPRANNPEAREEADGEIRLGVDVNGKFYLDITGTNGKYTGMRALPDDSMLSYLTRLYAARSVDKVLFFKADQNVEFSRVQQAVEIARKAGVRVIGAIAEQERQARAGEH
jgi:biopolymer transport protein TolR